MKEFCWDFFGNSSRMLALKLSILLFVAKEKLSTQQIRFGNQVCALIQFGSWVHDVGDIYDDMYF